MKLIVEMEMPKNCHECEAKCVNALYGRICGITRKNIIHFLDKPNRPYWCPIKGVLPEEHGDLIDRDALKKQCWTDDGFDLWVSHTEIDQQPTVIAAERRDDGKEN